MVRHKTSMLACVGLLTVSPLVRAQLVAVVRGEPMRSVAVTFGRGDTVTFRLAPLAGVVQGISARVLGTTYSVPLARCSPLANVRFDSLSLILGQHDSGNGTFTLTFRMGSEESGGLPEIQLSFYKGQFVAPLITRQTGPHSSVASSLCPGVPTQVRRGR